jgi:hypothetical protein
VGDKENLHWDRLSPGPVAEDPETTKPDWPVRWLLEHGRATLDLARLDDADGDGHL